MAKVKQLYSEKKKLAAYALGVIVALVSADMLHGAALQAALTAEVVLTGLGIHQATNA